LQEEIMNSRRLIGGLVSFGLVIFGFALLFEWVKHRVHMPSQHVRVENQMPPDSLGPGDMRLYNADSSVDIVLMGDKILAGLSAKTVAQIKGSLNDSHTDSTGLGGMISGIVKSSVAGAIGTHAVFPLAELKDIQYQDGRIHVTWADGGDRDLFNGTTVNHQKVSNSFNEADAKRFVAAVRARKGLSPE
jgi:hypothetical protein